VDTSAGVDEAAAGVAAMAALADGAGASAGAADGGPPLRLCLVSPDVPFPAHRGGRADVWRRLQALRRLGHHVTLVSFYLATRDGTPAPDAVRRMQAEVDDLHFVPIRRDAAARLRRLPRILASPWHAASRTLDATTLARLLAPLRAFGPDLVWCEGLWCWPASERLATALAVPVIYRSHNVEHAYMPRQAAAARSPRDRLAWTLACLGVERMERSAMARSRWVLDISYDDLAFWRGQGIDHASWLPPMAEQALGVRADLHAIAPTREVVFLGNLRTPNNLRGVHWLLTEVMPRVRALRPGTRVCIAGSRPDAHLHELCEAHGAELLADPPDAPAVYASGRVLVNPVHTGSGTQLKSVEMLVTDRPIVSAVQGTRGLPPFVTPLFRVADDAEGFARHVVAALEGHEPAELRRARQQAGPLFGSAGLARELHALAARLGLPRPAPEGR
jgi:polysaccharide biosynthesis protein PslH